MFAKQTPSLLVMSLMVMLPGCGKRKEATAPPPVSPTAQAEVQQAPAPAPVANVPPPPPPPVAQGQGPAVAAPPALVQVQVPQNGNFNATLSDLSFQLRLYVGRTRTAPKTFAEFIANSGVSAPQPPNGMHYAIQSGQVVLVR